MGRQMLRAKLLRVSYCHVVGKTFGMGFLYLTLGPLLAQLSFVANADTARHFLVDDFGKMIEGSPEMTAINERGEISLAHAVETIYNDEEVDFASGCRWNDSTALALVDKPKVISVDDRGRAKVIFEGTAGFVSALAAQGKDLLIAVSPSAKIYRYDAKRRSVSLWSELKEEYIWSMVVVDKKVFVATGREGRLYALDSRGKSSEVFKPDQTHIRSLHWNKHLGLFVGGGSRGVLYHSKTAAKGTFKALFDSGHSEITAIASNDESVFVAGVTGAENVVRMEDKGAKARSQVAQIWMDGRSEVVAGSNDEAVFAIARQGSKIFVGTGSTSEYDPRGRIYTIDASSRNIALVFQSSERRVVELLPDQETTVVVSAASGRLERLKKTLAKHGHYVSEVLDAQGHTRFGSVRLNGVGQERVQKYIRTGSTKRPDDSWSDWMEFPLGDAKQKSKAVGRFAQVKLVLKRKNGLSPSISAMRLSHQRSNMRPFVRGITVLEPGWALVPQFRAPPESQSINLNKTSKDSSESGADSEPGASTQRAKKIRAPGAISIHWSAEDPNADSLSYTLWIKGEAEKDWRVLAEDLRAPFYTMEMARIGGGRYRFKVQASDKYANAPGTELSDERISDIVSFDQRAPAWKEIKAKNHGQRLHLQATLLESDGFLRAARYSIDGSEMRPMLPADGVLDGPTEYFKFETEAMASGEHTVVIEAEDEGGNRSRETRRFKVP